MRSLLGQTASGSGDAAGALVVMVALLFYFAVIAFYVVVGWKIFAKAGRPGWAVIVPIYNAIVFIRMAGRPAWWFLLFLIPVVNIAITFIVYIDFCRKFGKGTGFAVLTVFFGAITLPILAFGSAQYDPDA